MSLEDIAKTFKLPELIRYLYSGCLLLGLVQLTDAKVRVDSTLLTLGPVLTTLLVFSSGILIWTIYHQVLGEFCFFILIHVLHWWWWPKCSDMKLLHDRGVPFFRLRCAYSLIRESLPPTEIRDWIEIQHAHHQLLDITWISLAGVALFSRWVGHKWPTGAPLFIVGGLFCFLASIVADINQHSIEKFLIENSDLDGWLDKHGFVDKKPVHPTSTSP